MATSSPLSSDNPDTLHPFSYFRILDLPPEIHLQIVSHLLAPVLASAHRHPLLSYLPLSAIVQHPIFTVSRAFRALLLSHILASRQVRSGIFISLSRPPPKYPFPTLRGAVLIISDPNDPENISLLNNGNTGIQGTDEINRLAVEAIIFSEVKGRTGPTGIQERGRDYMPLCKGFGVAYGKYREDFNKARIDSNQFFGLLIAEIPEELVGVAVAYASRWVEVLEPWVNGAAVRFLELPNWMLPLLLSEPPMKALEAKVVCQSAVRKFLLKPDIGGKDEEEGETLTLASMKNKAAAALKGIFSSCSDDNSKDTACFGRSGGIMLTTFPLFIFGLFETEGVISTVFFGPDRGLGSGIKARLQQLFEQMVQSTDICGLQLPETFAWRKREYEETVDFSILWCKVMDEMTRTGWTGRNLHIVGSGNEVLFPPQLDNGSGEGIHEPMKWAQFHDTPSAPELSYVFPRYILNARLTLESLTIITDDTLSGPHMCHFFWSISDHFPSLHSLTLLIPHFCPGFFEAPLSAVAATSTNTIRRGSHQQRQLTLYVGSNTYSRPLQETRTTSNPRTEPFYDLSLLAAKSRNWSAKTGWDLRFVIVREEITMTPHEQRVLIMEPMKHQVRFERRCWSQKLESGYVVVSEDELVNVVMGDGVPSGRSIESMIRFGAGFDYDDKAVPSGGWLRWGEKIIGGKRWIYVHADERRRVAEKQKMKEDMEANRIVEQKQKREERKSRLRNR